MYRRIEGDCGNVRCPLRFEDVDGKPVYYQSAEAEKDCNEEKYSNISLRPSLAEEHTSKRAGRSRVGVVHWGEIPWHLFHRRGLHSLENRLCPTVQCSFTRTCPYTVSSQSLTVLAEGGAGAIGHSWSQDVSLVNLKRTNGWTS